MTFTRYPQSVDFECADCGAELPNSSEKTAFACPGCNMSLDLTSRGGKALLSLASTPLPPRGLRATVRVHTVDANSYRTSGKQTSKLELMIRQSWMHPTAFIMAGFALLWDAFIVGWYVVILGDVPGGGGGIFGMMACCMLVVPLAHVGVGVFLTNTTLQKFFNATTIRLDEEGVSVKHGPLPTFWYRGWSVRGSSITQLMVRKKGKAWVLLADIAGEEMRTLLKNLPEARPAREIEALLEAILNIEDDPSASHPDH